MLLYLFISGFLLHFFQIKRKANRKCLALIHLQLAEREHHKTVKCLLSDFPHYSAFSLHGPGKPNSQPIVSKVDPSAAQILSFQIYPTDICTDARGSSQAQGQTRVYSIARKVERRASGLQGLPRKVLGPVAWLPKKLVSSFSCKM